jgi:hypothetical protein
MFRNSARSLDKTFGTFNPSTHLKHTHSIFPELKKIEFFFRIWDRCRTLRLLPGVTVTMVETSKVGVKVGMAAGV